CTFVHDFVSFVVWSLQNYKILGERLRSGPLFLWNLYYFALLSDSNRFFVTLQPTLIALKGLEGSKDIDGILKTSKAICKAGGQKGKAFTKRYRSVHSNFAHLNHFTEVMQR
ncbi:MAG: hypothetical protein IJV45_03640, partial [Prevotella sp.]|nr:hypothetical protein [Prevotella sp.]